MTDEEKESLLRDARRIKESARDINAVLLPKLDTMKDAFTPSEWHIIKLAIDNYIIDMTSEAARLQIMAYQNMSSK